MATFNGEEALDYYNALLIEKENAVANAISEFSEKRINERLSEEKEKIEAEVIAEITEETEIKYNNEIELLKKFIVFPVEEVEIVENEEVVL